MKEARLATYAAEKIMSSTEAAIAEVNKFTEKVFRTRGGRIGSGMGSVIEALWGFYLNAVFAREKELEYEMGWIYGHQYNDFACILSGEDWNPNDRAGELFRVEVKSMVASADESKAHFDRLQHEFDENELLAVFLWDWNPTAENARTVYPAILDYFVGFALPIARLRDVLHEARGGSFVTAGACPDGCGAGNCPHIGEPLNTSGVRERRTGPKMSKGRKASYAANFGGMLRMLGTNTEHGKMLLRKYHADDPTVARFIDFMARNFPRVAKSLKQEQ